MEDDKEDAEELKIQQMTEPEQKGYKDWLAAAAQVIFTSAHYNAHFSLVRRLPGTERLTFHTATVDTEGIAVCVGEERVTIKT